MNGSLCGRTHFVYRICVCSFVCLCAVGVDVIFQLLRVRSEGLGAQARQGRGCRVTWRAGVSGNLGAGDTSEGVGLDHLPLLPRKQPREVSKGSDQAEVRGHLGGGGGLWLLPACS